MRLLASAVLLSLVPLAPMPALAQASVPANAADARLRTLYEKEWAWRQNEFARVAEDDSWSASGDHLPHVCLLYTSPSPRDATLSRMPSSA